MPIDDSEPLSNPYTPPLAALGESSDELHIELTEAEATRKKYLNHEAAVRSIGTLLLAVAAIGVIAWLLMMWGFFTSFPAGNLSLAFRSFRIFLLLFAVLGLPPLILSFVVVIGLGIRRLESGARLAAVWLISLSVVGSLAVIVSGIIRGGVSFSLIGFASLQIIPSYALQLLGSSKSRTVFSEEYREIRSQTPHIKYRSGCMMKGLIALFVLYLLTALAFGIVETLRPIMNKS